MISRLRSQTVMVVPSNEMRWGSFCDLNLKWTNDTIAMVGGCCFVQLVSIWRHQYWWSEVENFVTACVSRKFREVKTWPRQVTQGECIVIEIIVQGFAWYKSEFFVQRKQSVLPKAPSPLKPLPLHRISTAAISIPSTAQYKRPSKQSWRTLAKASKYDTDDVQIESTSIQKADAASAEI